MRIALDIPPGLISDDTTFSSTGRYENAANMRFWRVRAELATRSSATNISAGSLQRDVPIFRRQAQIKLSSFNHCMIVVQQLPPRRE